MHFRMVFNFVLGHSIFHLMLKLLFRVPCHSLIIVSQASQVTLRTSHQVEDDMTSSELTCPFCAIANAYPPCKSRIPQDPDAELISPNCHLILSTECVLAFLDIMPITEGHVLVVSRTHREKLGDLKGNEGAALGVWLPVVSRAVMRALGRDNGHWNVVQNNGNSALVTRLRRWITLMQIRPKAPLLLRLCHMFTTISFPATITCRRSKPEAGQCLVEVKEMNWMTRKVSNWPLQYGRSLRATLTRWDNMTRMEKRCWASYDLPVHMLVKTGSCAGIWSDHRTSD